MQCPKCRSEVVDSHFYCSNCHALMNDSDTHDGESSRGMVERAGERLLNLIAAVFIISLLVLMARAIKWSDLVKSIRGESNGTIEAKQARAVPANSQTDRRSDPTNSGAPTESSTKAVKKDKVESVRALRQKIEELPSLPPREVSSQSLKPAPTPVPTKSETIPLTFVEPTPTQKSVPVRSLKEGAELGVERIEVKHAGEVGYVAIDSYVPARIYVNGQFSGLTPRTVKLSVGDHLIRLIAEGYEDWTRRVQLKSRQQTGIMASMKKKAAQ